MKKSLFCLSIITILSFPVVGLAYGESESFDQNPKFKDQFLIPDLTINTELSRYVYPNSSLNMSFNTNDVKKTKTINRLLGEGTPYTIEGIQYFSNINSIELVDGYITDLRPLNNVKNNKVLTVSQPLTSLTFLKNMQNLEELYLEAQNITNDEKYIDDIDESLYAITDLTVLNSLDNLQIANIYSSDRLFPTISLKKSMDKFILVNPFILSKQFQNSEVNITSKTPEFTFENDILTWNGITPNTKELQISWEFSTTDRNFIFSGDSTIPINWID